MQENSNCQRTNEKTQNKEPTLQELAEKTGIAIEDLVVAMEAGREVDSFRDR